MLNMQIKTQSLYKDNGEDLFRYEKDLLGIGQVPAKALYGIHTVRAIENFPLSKRRVHASLIKAFGQVKLAAAQTNRSLGFWDKDKAKADAIEEACREMAEGKLDDHIVVDALQGGAGTSTNMNVNEVLANRALQLLDESLGDGSRVSPLDDINLHQSTNDAYPTAFKLATIERLKVLDESLSALVRSFRDKAEEFSEVIKIGRTQLQDAVPISLGHEMASYADAFDRARARIDQAVDQLRIVNMGGTAIGTGIAAPKDYILRVAETLAGITGIDFKRASNLVDNTQNADVFVEVSGQLKTCATTFIKCCTDLRLMSSGPDGGFGEIRLPARQAGSSIMPGKVNPVIPETATQAAMRVIGSDVDVSMAASMGNLELNPFLPLMADSLLNGIDLLANAADILRKKCIEGIEANVERCRANVEGSTALVTSLVSEIGYERSSEIAYKAKAQGKTVREIVLSEKVMSEETFNDLIAPKTSFH